MGDTWGRPIGDIWGHGIGVVPWGHMELCYGDLGTFHRGHLGTCDGGCAMGLDAPWGHLGTPIGDIWGHGMMTCHGIAWGRPMG